MNVLRKEYATKGFLINPNNNVKKQNFSPLPSDKKWLMGNGEAQSISTYNAIIQQAS